MTPFPVYLFLSLVRPKNADFVTVIRYEWDGKQRSLVIDADEQYGGLVTNESLSANVSERNLVLLSSLTCLRKNTVRLAELAERLSLKFS